MVGYTSKFCWLLFAKKLNIESNLRWWDVISPNDSRKQTDSICCRNSPINLVFFVQFEDEYVYRLLPGSPAKAVSVQWLHSPHPLTMRLRDCAITVSIKEIATDTFSIHETSQSVERLPLSACPAIFLRQHFHNHRFSGGRNSSGTCSSLHKQTFTNSQVHFLIAILYVKH